MELIRRKYKEFKEFNTNEKLMVITLISLFLPMHISIPCLIISVIVAIYQKQLFKNMKEMPGAKYIYSFCVMIIVVSLIYKNYMGFINALGITLIFVFISFYRTVLNKKLFNYLLDLTLILSLVVAFIGILEYKAYLVNNDYTFLEVFMVEVPAKRLQVTFFNANYYATMIEIFIIMALYKMYNTNIVKKKIYYILIILINMIMMYLTGCRTAFGAIAIAFLIFYIFLGNKKLIYISLFVFILCSLIFFLNPHLIPRINEVFSALNLREEIWQGGLKMFEMRPLFGSGPQTYGLLSPMLNIEIAPHAHNMYIDSLCSYGIVGTLLSCMYLYHMGKDILNIKVNKSLFALIMALISAILFHGLFDLTLNYASTGCLALMILNSAKLVDEN